MPTPTRLLVIDEDPGTISAISEALENSAAEIVSEPSPDAAFETFLRVRPRVVFLGLANTSAQLEMLDRILEADPGSNVILITTEYSEPSALEAIRRGACDYLTKPLDIDTVRNRTAKLRSEAEIRRKTLSLDLKLLQAWTFEGIVSRSPLMLDVFARVRRIAPHFKTALITGPTGTGKELIARALHRLSPAIRDRFLACNCSALVETLVESELFGYVKGAFTGANQDTAGLFESSAGGTLFLDEIGELPLTAQAKLLRVLQDHQVRRVGSHVRRPVDLRVIAATNRDLKAMVREGSFREDLYYRLAIAEIALPRLEHRKEDLPLLERHFIERFSAEYKRPIAGMTRRAQTAMAAYSWPGNIRELENVINNACMMTEGPFIDIHDLPQWLREPPRDYSRPEEGLFSLQEAQKRHIVQVLERVGGNKQKAAKILGVGRNTIYKVLSGLKLESRNLSA